MAEGAQENAGSSSQEFTKHLWCCYGWKGPSRSPTATFGCKCPRDLELLIIPLRIQTTGDSLSVADVSCESLMFFRLEAGWSHIRQPSRAPFAPPSFRELKGLFSMEMWAWNQWTPSGSSGAGRAPASAGEEFGLERRGAWQSWSLAEPEPGKARALQSWILAKLEPCRAQHFYCGRKWGQAQALWTGIVCWKGTPGDFLRSFCRVRVSLENVAAFWMNVTMLFGIVELVQN